MPRRFRLFRPDVPADVDDELAFHLDMRARDLAASGMEPGAASRAAADAFGNVGAIRAACITIDERRRRREERVEYMSDFWQDLRFAVRALRQGPGFALTALVCVALGVGVATTIFSAVDAILIRPLPYGDPDRLVAVYGQNVPRGYHGTNISYDDYLDWRAQNRSFESLGIWTWTSHGLSGAGGAAERVDGAAVAADVFPLLRVRPIVGRTFAPGEETMGRDRVVLLGYALWQRRYGGDRGIVGRAITIDAEPYVVVGIMPPGFTFPESGELWVPFADDPEVKGHGNRFQAGAIGRLRPGVTLAQAQADLAAVSRRLEQQYPDDNRDWAAELVSLRQDLVGDLEKPLLLFFGAVGIVLLIACANVANLLLARGAARQREIAVRTAIGAGRGRLVRQLLTESLLLAAVGGVAGVALASAGVVLLRGAFPQDVPFFRTLSVDWRGAAFAMLLSAATGLLFGTVPALRAGRVDLTTTLRDGARGASEGLARSRLRSSLVVAELALSVVLMIGAGLLVRSYRALAGTDLGFREQSALTVRLSLPSETYGDRARRAAFFDALLARVAAMPGVATVGSGRGIPFSGWDVQGEMGVEGRAPARPGEELISHFQFVTPGFFDALGVPLRRGRGLRASDRDSVAMVGVVNETFVRQFFGGGDPIGQRVRGGPRDPWVTIVGVVGDYRHYRLPQPMGPAIYYPYAAAPTLTQTLVVRTTLADPLALVPGVRAAVRALDADVPLYQVQTLEQQVARSLWRQRLQGQVLGIFAVLALLLAAVGIYGVISYAVAQRTRELGVRVALGASRRQLLGLVLGQGARLAVVGVAVGLVGALALSRVVASLLYGVPALDPLTFGAVPVLLAAVALVASYVPARRATRVDPLIAMRDA